MKRLHFDPFDILHRRNKASDFLDIGGIVGKAWHEREPDPHRFTHGGETLGKAQGRSQIAFGRLPIGFRVPALDIEQHKVDG